MIHKIRKGQVRLLRKGDVAGRESVHRPYLRLDGLNQDLDPKLPLAYSQHAILSNTSPKCGRKGSTRYTLLP
jgi:hypothetical protein